MVDGELNVAAFFDIATPGQVRVIPPSHAIGHEEGNLGKHAPGVGPFSPEHCRRLCPDRFFRSLFTLDPWLLTSTVVVRVIAYAPVRSELHAIDCITGGRLLR